MSEEPEVIESEEEEVQATPGWFKFIVVAAIAVILVGAYYGFSHSTLAGEKIALSGNERVKAVGIAEHRQKIGFERQEAQNEFQAKMNRYAEEENSLNIEAAKLCFELKKSHKLNPTTNYILNEWAGELEKR
jgi:hypothetical protein